MKKNSIQKSKKKILVQKIFHMKENGINEQLLTLEMYHTSQNIHSFRKSFQIVY